MQQMLFPSPVSSEKTPVASDQPWCVPQGYILSNRVTHIRGLPEPNSHAFRYTTLSLLVGLDALESRRLDLASGWIFGYGGRWGRLLGLRPQPYLNTLSSASIRNKLEDEFRKHRMIQHDTFEDAWMMTMPSMCGFEGINPLTVYFCYKEKNLWAVVLEIHNTFGESHVHLLEIGQGEDSVPAKGYDHQWTFHRQFHVSPFNDRSGYYTISITSPGHSPRCYMTSDSAETPPPQPAVCIRLYTDSDSDSAQSGSTNTSNRTMPMHGLPSSSRLKLAAYLRTTCALPLTTRNVARELLKQPFVLFLTFPRILYHAWILHYRKSLDVLPRPEPMRPREVSKEPLTAPGGGVGWQEEGTLEAYTHKLVIDFLHRRVHETGISVSLNPANPNIPPARFPAPEKTQSDEAEGVLEISYLSPRFFTILFTSPSSEHAILLGSDTEELFQPSSKDLFNAVFALATPNPQQENLKGSRLPGILSMLQRIRRSRVPKSLNLGSASAHYLDADCSLPRLMVSGLVLLTLILVERLEKVIFRLARARFMEGKEPWNAWQRAIKVHLGEGKGGSERAEESLAMYGSVSRGT